MPFGVGWKDELLTKHAPNGEAVVAVAAVLPIHDATIEVQAVGVLNITTADGTRPKVAVTPHAVDTAIAADTSSRKKQFLT